MPGIIVSDEDQLKTPVIDNLVDVNNVTEATNNLTIEAGYDSKLSKSEKKSRKAVEKLGLKPVKGVHYVSFTQEKGPTCFIRKPDVFKCPHSGSYIIFGEAKYEDVSSQAQSRAAQQFSVPDISAEASSSDAQEEEEVVEEEVDETGVVPQDIELLMTQAGVSRSKAVEALKTNNGDIVASIMSLS